MISRRSIFKFLGIGVGSIAIGACKNSERLGIAEQSIVPKDAVTQWWHVDTGTEYWSTRDGKIFQYGRDADGYFRVSEWTDAS